MRLRHMIELYQEKEAEIGKRKLRQIRSEEEFEELSRQNHRMVVSVFVSKECILCQRMMPELEAINTDFYDKMDFCLVDCDNLSRAY